jgi:hypothetical protein
MSNVLKAVSVPLFGVLVAVALAVGTQTAFARSVTMDCPNDGNTRLGSCTSQAECQAKCDAVHQPPGSSQGVCSGAPNGCCHCLI